MGMIRLGLLLLTVVGCSTASAKYPPGYFKTTVVAASALDTQAATPDVSPVVSAKCDGSGWITHGDGHKTQCLGCEKCMSSTVPTSLLFGTDPRLKVGDDVYQTEWSNSWVNLKSDEPSTEISTHTSYCKRRMWNDREWLWVAGKLYVYDDDGKIVLYSKVKGAGWLRPFKNRRSSGTGSLAGGCSSGAGSCSGGSCGPGRGLFGRRR